MRSILFESILREKDDDKNANANNNSNYQSRLAKLQVRGLKTDIFIVFLMNNQTNYTFSYASNRARKYLIGEGSRLRADDPGLVKFLRDVLSATAGQKDPKTNAPMMIQDNNSYPKIVACAIPPNFIPDFTKITSQMEVTDDVFKKSKAGQGDTQSNVHYGAADVVADVLEQSTSG